MSRGRIVAVHSNSSSQRSISNAFSGHRRPRRQLRSALERVCSSGHYPPPWGLDLRAASLNSAALWGNWGGHTGKSPVHWCTSLASETIEPGIMTNCRIIRRISEPEVPTLGGKIPRRSGSVGLIPVCPTWPCPTWPYSLASGQHQRSSRMRLRDGSTSGLRRLPDFVAASRRTLRIVG